MQASAAAVWQAAGQREGVFAPAQVPDAKFKRDVTLTMRPLHFLDKCGRFRPPHQQHHALEHSHQAIELIIRCQPVASTHTHSSSGRTLNQTRPQSSQQAPLIPPKVSARSKLPHSSFRRAHGRGRKHSSSSSKVETVERAWGVTKMTSPGVLRPSLEYPGGYTLTFDDEPQVPVPATPPAEARCVLLAVWREWCVRVCGGAAHERVCTLTTSSRRPTAHSQKA